MKKFSAVTIIFTLILVGCEQEQKLALDEDAAINDNTIELETDKKISKNEKDAKKVKAVFNPEFDLSVNTNELITFYKNVRIDVKSKTEIDDRVEVYVTEKSKCREGGEWEKFKFFKYGSDKTVWSLRGMVFWSLSDKASNKNLFIKFRDKDKNESTCSKLSINLKKGWIVSDYKEFTSSDQSSGGYQDVTVAMGKGRFFIHGGLKKGGGYLADAKIYNSDNDTWKTVTSSPVNLAGHQAVWTGEEVLIWGGEGNDGGSKVQREGVLHYDPAKDTWEKVIAAGEPSPRHFNVFQWTGEELIVWGGYDSKDGFFNNGAIYNPKTKSWRAITMTNVPDARIVYDFYWDGKQLIFWGGKSSISTSGGGSKPLRFNDSYAYNPVADTWENLGVTKLPIGKSYIQFSCKINYFQDGRIFHWGGHFFKDFEDIYSIKGGYVFDLEKNKIDNFFKINVFENWSMNFSRPGGYGLGELSTSCATDGEIVFLRGIRQTADGEAMYDYATFRFSEN